MDSQQLVHVVNAGVGPDGKQRCRRCKEAMPLVSELGYPEGRLVVSVGENRIAIVVTTAMPVLLGRLNAAPECIALNGTPAHA
jgi:hypothetical protein